MKTGNKKKKRREGKSTLNEILKKRKPDDGAEAAAPAAEEEKSAEAEKAENAEAPQGEKNADTADERIRAAEAKAEEYLDMAQRVQADFDNFRRRNASARSEAFEEGIREMLKQMLPVVDNLERALAVETEDQKLKEGVELIMKEVNTILEKRGVTVIDRKGEVFDPRLENAVMRAEADAGEPGTVAAVFQKGYRIGDVILRHAMVQVVGE